MSTYISNMRYQKFCACKRALRNKNLIKNATRIGTLTHDRTRKCFNNQEIQINDFICGRCRTKAKKI